MKKFVKISALLTSLLPVAALAQTEVNPQYLDSILTSSKTLLDRAVVVLIAFAIVWFIWNVIRYVMSDELEKKETAKQQMIWGIVAIAVIVSLWGLVQLLQNIFNVNQQDAGGFGIDTLTPPIR